MKKNDLIILSITGITSEGSGVGRHEGMAVFVPMTAVGDLLRVRIVKVLASYSYGIIEEILTPSPDRVDPQCPVYKRCGGCDLRHISYPSELLIKNDWVHQNMHRIGGFELPMLPAVSSPQIDGYRNKAIFPVQRIGDKVEIGFYAKRSHQLIPSISCRLQPDFFTGILEAIKSFIEDYSISVYDELTHEGLVRSVFIRWGEGTGQVMVCLVINGNALPHTDELVERARHAHPGVCSVMLNSNAQRTNVLLGKETKVVYGTPTITDNLCGLDFRLSPLSFYQVNRQGAQRLYQLAADMASLKGDEILLDLYCGAGTIGLSMAGRVKEVIGVEIIPEAVDNAIQNASNAGIINARFLCADAAEAAAQLKKEGLHPDVVLLDPPRKGCELSVIESVVGMAPDRVVMISCNSATAARDVKEFANRGYKPLAMQAVDMFPRTAHVEVVIMMTRCGLDKKN